METPKGIIAWFARNSVAANLLMWALLIGGLFSTVLINKEVFPSFNLNLLSISVAYPALPLRKLKKASISKLKKPSKISTALRR